MHLDDAVDIPLEPPVVLKPRFGSWGRDVVLCETADDARRALRRLRKRRWFRRHGVIVQELVEPAGRDLRLIVTRTGVVGAIERRPAPGEWRTNVALGGTRHPIDPPEAARALAVAAADAVEGDLVGVDLLPTPAGDWLVLELNGAVDFTSEYSLPGRHVFRDVAAALAERALPQRLAATG
jgi:RimK family alpha-L-glutamate ligase